MRTVTKLDEAALLAAAPRAKRYAIYGDGVYLLVNPDGSKHWRVNVRRDGINTTLSLGSFPQTSIADALAERDRIRSQARAERQPIDHCSPNELTSVAIQTDQQRQSKRSAPPTS